MGMRVNAGSGARKRSLLFASWRHIGLYVVASRHPSGSFWLSFGRRSREDEARLHLAASELRKVRSDLDALSGDWRAVGGDIREAATKNATSARG